MSVLNALYSSTWFCEGAAVDFPEDPVIAKLVADLYDSGESQSLFKICLLAIHFLI